MFVIFKSLVSHWIRAYCVRVFFMFNIFKKQITFIFGRVDIQLKYLKIIFLLTAFYCFLPLGFCCFLLLIIAFSVFCCFLLLFSALYYFLLLFTAFYFFFLVFIASNVNYFLRGEAVQFKKMFIKNFVLF